MRIRSRSFPLPFALALGVASAAGAGDGVVEINHSCAQLTGCFAGDGPGYPVTIDGSAGRSYRLTSDLTAPNAGVDGIEVTTFDVSLDLTGFRIRRLGCADVATPCTPASGSGSGIKVSPFTQRGLSVRNGSLIGFGHHGVYGGTKATIAGVRVHWSRLDGIWVEEDSIVSGSSAHGNGGSGIVAGAGSTVTGNSASKNGDYGIATGEGSTIADNSARDNGEGGIFGGGGSTVAGNSSYSNTGEGITTANGCLVHGNTVRLNTGYGLKLGADSGFRENVISGNGQGAVSGTGTVNLGNNACNGSSTCLVAAP